MCTVYTLLEPHHSEVVVMRAYMLMLYENRSQAAVSNIKASDPETAAMWPAKRSVCAVLSLSLGSKLKWKNIDNTASHANSLSCDLHQLHPTAADSWLWMNEWSLTWIIMASKVFTKSLQLANGMKMPLVGLGTWQVRLSTDWSSWLSYEETWDGNFL